MHKILMDRLEAMAKMFPSFLSTVTKLNQGGISFAIGGSGCLYLLGNTRQPKDVDFFIPDDQHDQANQLFGISSFMHTSATDHALNSNPENDHDMQLTSQALITVDGREYPIRLTETVLQHRPSIEFRGQTIYLLPPEDALLDKALLQRGEDVGKHDIEDIKNFLSLYPTIDRAYLQQRIHELQAEERVGKIFESP